MKHRRAFFFVAKIIGGIKFGKDGTFSYSSGRMFNPADAVFINNIKPDRTFHIKIDETDDKGRFKRLSGFVGGKPKEDA